MGMRATRLAGGVGWLGSMALHLIVFFSALGVIPLAAGLNAIADSLRGEQTPEEPPKKKASAEEEGLKAAPPPPPEPAPPAGQEKPVEVRVPEPPKPVEEIPPEELEVPEVTLGIDESTATDTDTWLGFAEATPTHGGPAWGYEQAQLTRAPGERSATLDLQAGLGAGEPTDAQVEESALGEDKELGEGGTADETRDGSPDPGTFVAASVLPTITRAPEMERATEEAPDAQGVNAPGIGGIAANAAASIEQARATLEELRKRGGEGIAVAMRGGGRPVDETAKPAADAEPLDRSGAGGDENARGFLSDRDSDAAAIKQAISVNPGKPLAAKGLRIQTVRPKWSNYALATANPNDVVVRIWFDWTGRVTKAAIIQSSGRDDVDRPILDAVYNWRAAGEQLSTIKDQPDGRLQLVFKIDLER
jgi:TonB family protein